MLAASVISTMNVLWPRLSSSLAPTRVKMRSAMPICAACAGTKLPIWASSVSRATWRMKVLLPRHVRAGDEPEACPSSGAEHARRWARTCPAAASGRAPDAGRRRCRRIGSSASSGRHVAAATTASSASAASTSSVASTSAVCSSRARLRGDLVAQARRTARTRAGGSSPRPSGPSPRTPSAPA